MWGFCAGKRQRCWPRTSIISSRMSVCNGSNRPRAARSIGRRGGRLPALLRAWRPDAAREPCRVVLVGFDWFAKHPCKLDKPLPFAAIVAAYTQKTYRLVQFPGKSARNNRRSEYAQPFTLKLAR